MNLQNYLIKFYYIGDKRYYGSQRQKDFLTIEDCLIKALEKKDYLENLKDSNFELASRTDRYVSARASTFSFKTKKEPILMEINTALPKKIGVWAYTKVPNDFSSRFDAIIRHYRYIVPETLKDLKKNYKIDFKAMKWACNKLQGLNDFSNFCKYEKKEIKTVRNMEYVNMNIKGAYIIFDFKSKAFLRQQIRRMVQKILDLGKNIIKKDDFIELFNPIKKFSYQPADPKGLILWDIEYNKEIKFQTDLNSKRRMDDFLLFSQQKQKHKYFLFKILQQDNFS